ncbi:MULTISPECIES: heavy-metal-associated domain-containing protein [unclassified Caulobacter]|jgi:copper chaperone|uniref:Heavy metal transporter n=1 Tax=Caulobacter vibrioides TaxID=155892 RepID=A0A258D2R9_CAUVI|nr:MULTISPECIES: heavy-metal-associated domain-containing protein [unclassified Caulobacter]AZS19343.1 copper chaperone [Caulobacter sp. FWC26]MCA0358993.1 heavy-metal-associated domain-containing protein [Pseudomonadota bacterium]MDR7232620.1 copper chaperone [Caulobacter sp. BE264]OYX02220.1 MAG: heavy metal transporter [Caulobacter vibrioides]
MLRYTIENMTCGHCVATVTKAVQGVDANAIVRADVAGRSLEIDTGATSEIVSAAVAAAGYRVTPA